MKRTLIAIAFVIVLAAGITRAADTLDIYFIDTEGGQATLLITPAGQAMLIDSGFADEDSKAARDATRIAAAAALGNVKRLDVFMPTHFHGDHVGGVEQVAAKLPIVLFVDDGPAVQDSPPLKQRIVEYSEIYAAQFAKGKHLVVKGGDKIPLKDVEVTVVTANGKPAALPGKANPNCAGLERRPPGNPEDTESIGVLVQFGRFRFTNFGDMPWNQELDLLCPDNRVGQVDLYETPAHGREPSKAVAALAPRVAVADNGARKGAGAVSVKAFKAMPGLEDLWLLHFNVPGGAEANPANEFIANLDEPGSGDQGKYLKVSAMKDGSFTLFNARTNTTKKYAARR